jgi:hypothetical protein
MSDSKKPTTELSEELNKNDEMPETDLEKKEKNEESEETLENEMPESDVKDEVLEEKEEKEEKQEQQAGGKMKTMKNKKGMKKQKGMRKTMKNKKDNKKTMKKPVNGLMKWTDFAVKLFRDNRKKNPKYQYKQALKDASKILKKNKNTMKK